MTGSGSKSGNKETPHLEGAASLDRQHFPILRDMSPVHLQILNGAAHVMHVSAGVEIVQEGEVASSLFFIRTGKLAVAKSVRGKPRHVTDLAAGNVLGEFGLLRDKPRSASVYTEEHCQIIRVDKLAVQQVLEVDRGFHKRLNQLLRERLLDSFFFSHPVFEQLSSEQRAALTNSLCIQLFKPDDSICRQGDRSEGIYFILSGMAEIHHVAKNGKDLLLDIRRTGDMIGESEIGRRKKLPYSSTATSDLDLLFIDQQTLNTIGRVHAPTLAALHEDIRERAAHTMARIEKGLTESGA